MTWQSEGAVSDQKVHTKKSKRPHWTFCMGHCLSLCDQIHIAAMTSPPLAVRSKFFVCFPAQYYLIQFAKYCQYFNCDFWRKFAHFCTIYFIKVFLKSFFEFKKKMFIPVHKPDAVDYIIFNFGEFLSISYFVWRTFIKQSSISFSA
jgi:hypothetical protein